MASALQEISSDMADLVEASADSVVQVDARRRLPATGIAWSEELVVCAHHTVEFEDDISIGTADGQRLPATLVGRDPRIDLALLRLEASLKPGSWAGHESLRAGNLVLALGRPRQHIRASLGIVTGLAGSAEARRPAKRMKALFGQQMKGQSKQWKGRHWRKRRAREGAWALAFAGGIIHSDVTMYPGFSGGALLGADGNVYGMTTSGFPGGMSTAIPLASIRESVAALLAKGKIPTGYLGIGAQTAQLPAQAADALNQDYGLLIVSIEADSPAAKAGLLVGDIVTALGGSAIEQIDELQVMLTRLEVGSDADISYARGGELHEGKVLIGEK